MATHELAFGVGALVLLAALVWGYVRYVTRNKANDRITEEATRELYEHPDDYDRRRAELQKQIRR